MGAVVNGMKVSSVTPRMAILTRNINVRIPEMVRVVGSKFVMGSIQFPNSQPIRQVTLGDFAIGKYPVTNGEYRSYLEVMGAKLPALVADSNLSMHPVVNVSWNDATKYCKFLMEITGRKFGLPTEAQWEFAARGTEGRKYPWGEKAYEGRANFHSSGTTPVDAHPKGKTPAGIFDMSGNVCEWVMDWYGNGYNAYDLVNPKGLEQDPCNNYFRVLRGGSWSDHNPVALLAACRDGNKPEYQHSDFGFRLAEDLG